MGIARKLVPEPHACPICKTRVVSALPTCPEVFCRKEWRRETQRLTRQAREAWRAEHKRDFCTRCQKKHTAATLEAGYKTCANCRAEDRRRRKAEAEARAVQLYKETLALARAERLIAKREAEDRQRIAEAKAYVDKVHGKLPDVSTPQEHEI